MDENVARPSEEDLNNETLSSPASKPYFKIIGILFILFAVVISLFIKCPTNAQYFIIYALIGVGIALLLAKSAEKSSAKFSINNVAVVLSGGVTLPFVLFFTNPIGRFKTDGCQIYTTNITVSVHGKQGKQDMILRQKGFVVMDIIGKETKRSSINENGQAFFQDLSIGDSIRLNIDFSEPYKSTKPDSIYLVKSNENIYLPVKLEGIDKIWGKVLYKDEPLKGVIVQVISKEGNLTATTDILGDFRLSIPEYMQVKEYQVSFTKEGFKSETVPAYPQTNDGLNIIMEKR